MRSDRAQSETLGFVFVFAIVVTTIGLVSVAGYGTLDDAQRAQQTNNAESAVEILADNVGDLARGAPSRTTEVELAGAQLLVGEPVHVRVSGQATNSPGTFSVNRSVVPVVYRADDGTAVVYVAGAVLRDDGDGTAVLRDPPLLLAQNRTAVQLVQTRASGARSVGSGSTVLVHAERAGAELLRANASEHDLTVAVTSPRADAWERTLSARPGVTCARPSSRTVACTVTTDAVYVSAVRVDVSFS